ncbi:Crp/Fnr family transcriptional regulator [uncultured Arcticibacterium sp.]|uniref:Crp/Fnr family transcriptional regulator n=1 Tax=uncultured Arcticibacterium sp. TaxID=2173042 RepID=UPI0030F80FFB
MQTQNSIISEIFKTISFSADEIKLVESKFEKITLEKGATLLNAGKTVNHQYFISSGCLRTYFIDNSGKEHTIQFAIQDWWISDYTAFFTSSTAIMTIDCIQDAVVYKVSKEAMDGLYLKIPSLETFFRKKMEGAFASFQKRILGSLSQSAKERYTSFISTYPNIEQSVKNYHIASYLGITTESLSRIRKEIAQK